MSTRRRVESHEARGHKTAYNEDYDTVYCVDCREWLESRCPDPLCEYCRKRPATPPRTVNPH